MGFRGKIDEAMPRMFNRGGEDAVFTSMSTSPPVSKHCKILIEFDVALQPTGYEAQVHEIGTTIEAVLSEIETIPACGDTFAYKGVTYEVQSIRSNDGFTVVAVVR